MSESKKKTKPTHLISAVQHAAKLTQDFAQVHEQIEKPEENREKKIELRKRVNDVITQGLLEEVCPAFPTKTKRRNFRNLICDLILDIVSSMVPQDQFEAIHQSFRGLVPKIQALDVASLRREGSQGALQHVQTADDEVSASTADKRSDVYKETSKQVLQPAIRLQGSVDFSIDQERNQEPDERTELKVKEEDEDETATTEPLDPTGFTITLGVPTAPGDHRFYIRFNNKRVVDCLTSMPANEIWQLVHDTIQQDSDIPRLPLPRVTEVCQQDDECLALTFRTAEDLRTLSANVQWVRTFRDTLSNERRGYQFPAEAASEQQTPAPSEAALHTLSSPELPLPKARKVQESPDKNPRQGYKPPRSAQAATNILPAKFKPKNQNTADKKSRPPPTTMPPPAIRTNPKHTHEPPSSPPTPLNQPTSTHHSPPIPAPSALLQTIDEFRAFVAAREAIANPRKRKQSEYVMTGALQLEEHEGQRVKRVKQKGEEVEGGEDGEEEREDEGPVWPIGHEGYRPPPPPLRRRESRDALFQALSKLAH